MSATVGFCYDDIFNLVSQLAPAEQERLVRELPKRPPSSPAQSEPESRLTDEYIRKHGIRIGNGLIKVTVPGKPFISAEEREEVRRRYEESKVPKTPEELEKNRQELLEIILNCPVFTDEELKGFEEARKELNECLARL